MNSPSQKDSGIDDSSPLSYEDPVEQAQVQVYPPLAKGTSSLTEKVCMVDSSTSNTLLVGAEFENHNSVADCETCVEKSAVQEPMQLVHSNTYTRKCQYGSCDETDAVILVDSDSVVQEPMKLVHSNNYTGKPYFTSCDEADAVILLDSDDENTANDQFKGSSTVGWNVDSSAVSNSCVTLAKDSSVSMEEVAITSTTSPEREGLLKEAGLLTVSSCRKKGGSSKVKGIFDIFNIDNINKVDSTGDLIQVTAQTRLSAKHNMTVKPSENSAELDPCDSTENLVFSNQPDSISRGTTSSDNKEDGSSVNVKECSESKNSPDGARRNIFEVLTQETSMSPQKYKDVYKDGQNSPSRSPNRDLGPEKYKFSSSQCRGTDFESATGESRFNFYNSNEVAKDPCMDSNGVVYNDCYMVDEGGLQSLQNTCSSVQSDDDNDCNSQDAGTPSKYAFLSQDNTRMKDVLGLNEVSSVEEESSKHGPRSDSQCEFTKSVPCDSPNKIALSTPGSRENSNRAKVTDINKTQHLRKGWTMSSRQIKCFQNSHQRLVLLRRKICKFLRLAFPFLQYPAYFKTHAVCVENLIDQLTCIMAGSKGKYSVPHAIPTEKSCCEVRVVVCKSPRQCLNYLRRKLVRFLQAALPDMKMSPSFDTSSEMVDTLLQKIIVCNQNVEKPS